MLYLVIKILTEKTVRYLGITHFSLEAFLYFSFQNIFKIKDKILLTFSVKSQNVQLNGILKKVQLSSIQNVQFNKILKKGQRTYPDIFHM